jgi:hypothetical protein
MHEDGRPVVPHPLPVRLGHPEKEVRLGRRQSLRRKRFLEPISRIRFDRNFRTKLNQGQTKFYEIGFLLLLGDI